MCSRRSSTPALSVNTPSSQTRTSAQPRLSRQRAISLPTRALGADEPMNSLMLDMKPPLAVRARIMTWWYLIPVASIGSGDDSVPRYHPRMPIDMKALARTGAEARINELQEQIAEIQRAFPGIGESGGR